MAESSSGAGPSQRLLRVFLALSIVTMMLGWFGCAEEPKPVEQTAKAEEAGGDEGGGEEGGEEVAAAPPKKPTKPDGPAEIMKKLPYEDVTIKAKDRLVLFGRLYDPSLKPKPPVVEGEEEEEAPAEDEEAPPVPTGPIKKYPLIILLHSLNGNYADWSDLPAKLVEQGYAVFAMDLRGHGKSSSLGKKLIGWRNFQPGDWGTMARDVEDVQKFFENAPKYPEVDNTRVALIGGGLGANVALKAASDYGTNTKAIVLLSPSLEIKGISASQSVLYYTHPIFIAASQEDAYFAQSAESIFKWAQGPKSIRIYKKIGQGTEMLIYESTIKKEILQWLDKRFPPLIRIYTPPPPPPEEAEGEGDAAAEEKKPAHH